MTIKRVLCGCLCFGIFLLSSCKKEEITVINTQVTPDLSNPIIQKLTNITWYRNTSTTTEEWVSEENIPKPSEAMASMMYNLAWVNFTLYRDGTSNMVYVPPIFPYTYIHCRGTWKVSESDENTIILTTKTPVSNATSKIMINNMETKDNVSYISLSMDFGNRLLKADFVNNTSETRQELLDAVDYNWFAASPVKTDVLIADDFIGAWASSSYDQTNMDNTAVANEWLIRSIQLEDLLAQTPNFISGLLFNLQANGKAQLAYSPVMFNQGLGLEKQVVSEATWSIKGNKVWIDTDEEFFYSVGELVFGLTVHAPALTYHGILKDTPIRTSANRFYAIEVIKQDANGYWSRVTTNDAIFYAFLFKSTFDAANTINIKDIVK